MTVLVLAFALKLFAWRRWRELRRELAAHVQIETTLRASEARYRAVVTQAVEGIFLFEAENKRIVEANPAFCQLVGYTTAELAGLTLYDLIAHDRASINANTQHIVADGKRTIGEREYRRKDGALVPVEVSATALTVGGEALLCVVVRDLTERCEAEAERDEARRLLAAEREAERQRIAWELHDGPVQHLLGVRHHLAAIGRRSARDHPNENSTPAIGVIEGEIVTVARELRALVGALRPVGLEERGLTTALDEYIARLRQESVVPLPTFALTLDPAACALPLPVARLLLRVAQEAIRNTLRHASAANITVSLALTHEYTELVVADDGRGAALPARLSALTRAGHFGLVGLEEAVTLAGGFLSVESQLGFGTIVTARLPITAQGGNDDGE